MGTRAVSEPQQEEEEEEVPDHDSEGEEDLGRCTYKSVFPSPSGSRLWRCPNRAAAARKSCEKHLMMRRNIMMRRKRYKAARMRQQLQAPEDEDPDQEQEPTVVREHVHPPVPAPAPVLVLGPTRARLGLQRLARPSRPPWPPANAAKFARLMAGCPAGALEGDSGAALPASPQQCLAFECENALKQRVCLRAAPVASSEADGEGVRLALVTCSVAAAQSDEVLWGTTVRANPIAVCGNGDSVWAVAGERGKLFVLDGPRSGEGPGPLQLLLDSNVELMACRKGSCNLLCVTGSGVVHLWDFRPADEAGGGVSLLRDGLCTSLYPRYFGTCNRSYQELPRSLRVGKASLSHAGWPVLQLLNGNCFAYDKQRSSWLRED